VVSFKSISSSESLEAFETRVGLDRLVRALVSAEIVRASERGVTLLADVVLWHIVNAKMTAEIVLLAKGLATAGKCAWEDGLWVVAVLISLRGGVSVHLVLLRSSKSGNWNGSRHHWRAVERDISESGSEHWRLRVVHRRRDRSIGVHVLVVMIHVQRRELDRLHDRHWVEVKHIGA
jgi:hypothetical protein